MADLLRVANDRLRNITPLSRSWEHPGTTFFRTWVPGAGFGTFPRPGSSPTSPLLRNIVLMGNFWADPKFRPRSTPPGELLNFATRGGSGACQPSPQHLNRARGASGDLTRSRRDQRSSQGILRALGARWRVWLAEIAGWWRGGRGGCWRPRPRPASLAQARAGDEIGAHGRGGVLRSVGVGRRRAGSRSGLHHDLPFRT